MPEGRSSRITGKRALTLLGGAAALVLVGVGAVALNSAPSDAALETQPTAAPASEETLGAVVPTNQPNELPTDQTVSLAGLSPAVAAQLQYVIDHWNAPNSASYGYLDDSDCVNFTSQSLLVRGWTQSDEWWNAQTGDALDTSPAWRSSTAFRDWLSGHAELATALDDSQRDQLAVGDIVQFDWDNSGDRDHTGIVTKIERNADGSISVYYAGHTDDTLVRSVDWAILVNHPGGTAYYWHVR
ncbi:MAG: amidase domain-containing protein [Agromyces sp.]